MLLGLRFVCKKFVRENTHYGNAAFRFDGKGSELLWIHVKGFLLLIPTLGFYSSWWQANIHNYYWNRTSVNGIRFKGDLKGEDILVYLILSYMLLIFTLFLAFPWVAVIWYKLYLESISMEVEPDLTQIRPEFDPGASALAKDSKARSKQLRIFSIDRLNCRHKMEDKFYDGKTPVPISGTLEAQKESIVFKTDTKSFQFAYADILSLEKVGKEYRLEIRNPSDRFIGYILVFHSEESYHSVIENQRSKKGNRLVSFWLNSKFPVKIAILFLTAIVVFMGYNQVLSHAYFFVPLTYDKEQSRVMSSWIRDYLPECTSPSLKKAVKKITRRLKEEDDPFVYDVIIVDEKVFNAFAMPGGTIVLFTELISKTQTPEELAGVLAHEMAHIHKRHGVRRQIRSAGNVALLSLGIGSGFEGVDTLENMDTVYEILGVTLYDQKFSREYEAEADEIALEKLKKSSIGAIGFLNFFERLKAEYETQESGSGEKVAKIPDFLSSHPATDDRIQFVKDSMVDRQYPPGKLGISKKDWSRIKNLCDPSTPAKK